MQTFLEILKAFLLGIVEGITEWLPISSTGHMILLDEWIHLNVSPEFKEMLLVVIQLGAVAAVPVLFFGKLFPWTKDKTPKQRRTTLSLWGKVIVGALPAAVAGLLLDNLLETYLYRYEVVAAALVIYGIAFLLVEHFRRGKAPRVERVEDMTYLDAVKIGCFQVLALIPGTSRSGSTILGGILSGVSRTASAEFSFFMAIPIMIGASGYKLLKFLVKGFHATGTEIMLLLVGLIVSFLVSLAVIRFLMDFVKRHSFVPFGIYRIALGMLVLLYFLIRTAIA